MNCSAAFMRGRMNWLRRRGNIRRRWRCKPDLARVQLSLATVLAAEGDKEGAAAHFREAAKGSDAAVARQAEQALRDHGNPIGMRIFAARGYRRCRCRNADGPVHRYRGEIRAHGR